MAEVYSSIGLVCSRSKHSTKGTIHSTTYRNGCTLYTYSYFPFKLIYFAQYFFHLILPFNKKKIHPKNYISSNIGESNINGILQLFYSRTNYLLSDFSILPSDVLKGITHTA